eukprot:GHVR01112400.1.p2 GENE.GHVR01112400.1~~GHVR01112400.1.p2  ORF type:complete len:262 (-),score=55.97 GHVR01112400.1:82-867(-)
MRGDAFPPLALAQGAGGDPVLPLGAAAGEGVDVYVTADAGNDAGGAILPEAPGLAGVGLGRGFGGGAQPEVVAVEAVKAVLSVEFWRGVDEGALAVVTLDHIEPAAHLVADFGCWGSDVGAGGGKGVPFHVEHRGKHAGGARHVADEPAGLILGGGAEVVEVVGAALYGRLARALPVGVEVDVFQVTAFGCFDEGEVHAVLPGGIPIDVVLKTGHVDAVDGIGSRVATVEIHWVAVAEFCCEEHAGGRRGWGAWRAAGGEG